MLVRARSPWPSRLWAFKHHEQGWRAGAGVTLFLAGAFVALIAPLVWRDARRVRAQQRREAAEPSPRPAA